VRRICLAFCLTMLGAGSAPAENTNKNAPAPARRAAPPQQVIRPAMMPRQAVSKPGPGVGPQHVGPSGGPGSGRSGIGVAGNAPMTPRSQLYEMVRPAPLAAPRMAGPTASAGRQAASGAFTPKPSHIAHNPAHRLGSAGSQHDHSTFVFRRGDRAFHRRYYFVEGQWFWYDEPVPDGDPAFASALDPNVPVCDEQLDECY
jgi:hypothetical protein